MDCVPLFQLILQIENNFVGFFCLCNLFFSPCSVIKLSSTPIMVDVSVTLLGKNPVHRSMFCNCYRGTFHT